MQHYLENIRARGNLFTRQEITDIFSNVETIYQLNSQFAKSLEDAFVPLNIGNETVCNVFTTMVPMMRVYEEYYKNFDRSNEVRKYHRENKTTKFAYLYVRSSHASFIHSFIHILTRSAMNIGAATQERSASDGS